MYPCLLVRYRYGTVWAYVAFSVHLLLAFFSKRRERPGWEIERVRFGEDRRRCFV